MGGGAGVGSSGQKAFLRLPVHSSGDDIGDAGQLFKGIGNVYAAGLVGMGDSVPREYIRD